MVAYEVLDGVQASQLVDEVGELYAEVFAEPPYLEGPQDVARFMEHFTDEMTRPGSSLVRAADGSVLVGVVRVDHGGRGVVQSAQGRAATGGPRRAAFRGDGVDGAF
jgi:hypothetical protein